MLRSRRVDRLGLGFGRGSALVTAVSHRPLFLPALRPPRRHPTGCNRGAYGVDSCRSVWAVRLGSASSACATAGIVCSDVVGEAAAAATSGDFDLPIPLLPWCCLLRHRQRRWERCVQKIWPTRGVGLCGKTAGSVLGLWSAACGFGGLLRCDRTETTESRTGERGEDPRPTRPNVLGLPAADGFFSSQSGFDCDGVSPVQGWMATRPLPRRRSGGGADGHGVFGVFVFCPPPGLYVFFLGALLQCVLGQLCFCTLLASAACMLWLLLG